jgi:prolyl oligopeptidase
MRTMSRCGNESMRSEAMRPWSQGGLGLVAALICLAAGCSGQDRITKTSARPPVTRVTPVTEARHGVSIVDNYRWLEGSDADADRPGTPGGDVAAWTEAQNQYTRRVLDRLPGREVLEARFRSLMRTGSVTAPIMRGNRYFFANATADRAQPVVYWRDGYLGADKVAVDPADVDPAGRTRIVWFSPSEDGKLLAVGSHRAGDPGPAVHLVEVDTRKRLPLEIPDVPGAVQWLSDGSGFFYQRVIRANDTITREGLLHVVNGRAPDLQLFREVAPTQNQNLADTSGPFGSLSRDGHWVVLGYWRNPGSNDLWVANVDDFRRTGRLDAKVASVGAPGQAAGTVVGGTLFLQTTKGAPNGRVVAASAADPAQTTWRNVVPERSDATIEALSVGRDRIAVTYRKNAGRAASARPRARECDCRRGSY